ncbi:MAG: glycosyltransferase family 1 protein [Chloroflexi bacterium]|nr:glycosyltransferase family 1 protein [Chloroflexota bacterium]
MMKPSIDYAAKHRAFLAAHRKHILMITNHGVHQWRVVPGLPDTGGQNVFVNRFTGELARLGFKVTIANRGGYPHPRTGERQEGLHYKDERRRILYIDDGGTEFIRKEDMGERIPCLTELLAGFLNAEDTKIDLILSHYWDGALLGIMYNRTLAEQVKHVWIPHSLGIIKKRNVSPDRWDGLRVDERIAVERGMIEEEFDGIAATSSVIRQALEEDYEYGGTTLFLPPCVDTERFYPQEMSDKHEVWEFLSRRCGLLSREVRECKIVTEISRTDTTKRKNVLIQAFAIVQQSVPDSLLIISIDDSKQELAKKLEGLIRTLPAQVQEHIAVIGSVWDILPALYAVTDVYCTPSVMEGFGMSAQEAAATGVPVVASHLVPFATEYLLGQRNLKKETDNQSVKQGDGALIVQADDVDGFARALEILLTDDNLRTEMGQNAYRITVPYFTWQNRVPAFLDEIGESLRLE